MSSKLCSSCNLVFTGSRLLKLERGHHHSRESIMAAADLGCYICGIITKSDAWIALDGDAHFESTWYLEALSDSLSGWFDLTIDAVGMGQDLSESSEGSEEDPTTLEPGGVVEGNGQMDGEMMTPTLISGPIWGFAIQPARDIEGTIEYTPPKDPDHPGILDLGFQWLSKCKAEHSTCNTQNPAFLPTRLLEILSPNHGQVISTQESQNEMSSQSYATLSHCWGKAKTMRLMTSNIEQLRSSINIAKLPASYQEAIRVCNRFGFRYIWIDSLCIIQDSPEDWRREAMAMKGVYRNSMMNIAAAAAAENTELSFTARDSSAISPLPIDTRWDGHEPGQYYLTNLNSYRDEVGSSPLRRRAWVVQEVWLSPRNLYLTKNQLWWKCCELEASEAYPAGLPEELSSLGSHTGYGKQRYDTAGLHHTWNRLVETYSTCNLTVPSDKMIAFAGIAQHFQTLLGSSDVYVAGIWRSQLPQALCWFATKEYRACRPSAYRAPSWSWASMDGGIRFGHNPPNAEHGSIMPICSVVECQTYPADKDPTGSLKGGSIKILGSLTKIGFSNDRITIQRFDGLFSLIPGVDTMTASDREEHWTLVDFDENTEAGYATCSYFDGFTLEDLANGNVDKSARKTKPSLVGAKHLLCFSLPMMRWIEGASPWMKGLILCLVEVEGARTYQRVGRFTARGSIPISRLMQNPAEAVLIL